MAAASSSVSAASCKHQQNGGGSVMAASAAYQRQHRRRNSVIGGILSSNGAGGVMASATSAASSYHRKQRRRVSKTAYRRNQRKQATEITRQISAARAHRLHKRIITLHRVYGAVSGKRQAAKKSTSSACGSMKSEKRGAASKRSIAWRESSGGVSWRFAGMARRHQQHGSIKRNKAAASRARKQRNNVM